MIISCIQNYDHKRIEKLETGRVTKNFTMLLVVSLSEIVTST